MDRKTQDLAWSILPKEFREEVKYEYSRVATKAIKSSYDLGFMNAHEGMYGIHNLTSDAEEEEMLTVKAKTVREMYAANDRLKSSFPGTIAEADADKINHILRHLFGSKCLPDEGTDCTPVEVGVAENATTSNVDSPEDNVGSSHGNVESLEAKPAEPRFKVGDKVRIVTHLDEDTPLKGEVCEIVVVDEEDPVCTYYLHNFSGEWYSQSDLKPYTEQEVKRHVSVKEACEILGVDESEATKLVKSKPIETCTETCTDDCSSSDHFGVKDEMVDNIIKDGFKNHNRLHIAAMAMAGLLANEGVSCFTDIQDLEHMDFITYHAFEYADKLIKKSEEENDI